MSELTEDEPKAIKTIKDTAEARLTGDPNGRSTPRGSFFFTLIGAHAVITSLALTSVDDFAAAVGGWKLSGVPTSGQPPVERPPPLMENCYKNFNWDFRRNQEDRGRISPNCGKLSWRQAPNS